MRIDRTNYEIFFLDYFEGSLSPGQAEELMAFLDAEPDLRAEFEAFEMVTLDEVDDKVVFAGKDSLKRGQVTSANYEWYFAAYAEGDLSAEERSATEAFAATSPAMQRELDLMQKTRLQPDLSIKFAGKSALKRRKVIPLYTQMMRYGAAAAVILFMATLFFMDMPQPKDPQLADLPVTREEVAPAPAPEITPQQPSPAPETEARAVETPQAVSPAPAPSRPADSEPSAVSEVVPRSLLASRLPARGASPIEVASRSETSMEQRSEFAYWHLRNRTDDFAEETETPVPSLFQLAYEGVQRNIPEDIRRVEERLAASRPSSLRELAGAVGSFIGNPLGLESERDENGRLVQLAIGNSFEITRK